MAVSIKTACFSYHYHYTRTVRFIKENRQSGSSGIRKPEDMLLIVQFAAIGKSVLDRLHEITRNGQKRQNLACYSFGKLLQ